MLTTRRQAPGRFGPSSIDSMWRSRRSTVRRRVSMARYVRLTVLSNWGGISPQYGLSEVRFFYTHPAAIEADASDN